jgi:GntR family transcriptional regulator
MAQDETEKPRTGYRRIATTLIEEIRGGAWRVGEKLPTESALVDRFGASRNTVREALRELQDFGYLSKRRGTRSEVVRSAPDTSFLNSIRSVEELVDYVQAAHSSLLSAERVILLEEQARQLDCLAGSEWMRLQLLRRRDPTGAPFCYSEAYIDPKFADVIGSLGPAYDIHRTIEARYDVVIARVIQQIEASSASAGVALKLQVPAGAPILLARTTFLSTAGAVVEVGLAHFATGRYRMKIALDRRRVTGP